MNHMRISGTEPSFEKHFRFDGGMKSPKPYRKLNLRHAKSGKAKGNVSPSVYEILFCNPLQQTCTLLVDKRILCFERLSQNSFISDD